MLQRMGVLQGTSRQVLAALGDSRYWLEVIGKLEDELDYRTIANILQFHQQQRDGRAAQQINLTSLSFEIRAEDVEEARAIVRELRSHGNDDYETARIESTFAARSPGEEKANTSLMLLDGEGGNLVG